jgi:hypothetical protein
MLVMVVGLSGSELALKVLPEVGMLRSSTLTTATVPLWLAASSGLSTGALTVTALVLTVLCAVQFVCVRVHVRESSQEVVVIAIVMTINSTSS